MTDLVQKKNSETKDSEDLSDFNKKLIKGLDFNPKERRVSGLSLKRLQKRKDHKNNKDK